MFLARNFSYDIYFKKYLFVFDNIDIITPKLIRIGMVAEFYKFKDVLFDNYLFIICLFSLMGQSSSITIGNKSIRLDKIKRGKFLYFYINSCCDITHVNIEYTYNLLFGLLLIPLKRGIATNKFKASVRNKITGNAVFINIPIKFISRFYPFNLTSFFSTSHLFKSMDIYLYFNSNFISGYFLYNFSKGLVYIRKKI